jgi:hypothetical protein
MGTGRNGVSEKVRKQQEGITPISADQISVIFDDDKDVALRKTSPEQRMASDEQKNNTKDMGKTTMLERTLENTNKIMKALDTGAGMGAAGLFIASGTYFEKGDYKLGMLFIAIGVFLSVAKHKLPDGPITQFLRGDILENLKRTFGGR